MLLQRTRGRPAPAYSDATGVGRSGSHKEQQTHSDDGIWWFNHYKTHGPGLQHKPVMTGDYITDSHKSEPYSDIGPDYSSVFPYDF